MKFAELIEEIKELITQEGYIAEINTVHKNNDLDKIALVVKRPNCNIGANFYIEEMIEDLDGQDDIAQTISKRISEFIERDEESARLEKITKDLMDSYENCKLNIYPRLKLVDWNRNIDNLFKTGIVCDFYECYAVRIFFNEGGSGQIMLTNEIVERWADQSDRTIDAMGQIIKSQARENEYFNTKMEKMEDVLRKMMGMEVPEEFDMSPVSDCKMWVVTNAQKTQGGNIIGNNLVGNMILDRMGVEKIWLLPSSVHESIVIPFEEEEKKNNLRDMICMVNDEQLSQEERLSFHPYTYERGEWSM